VLENINKYYSSLESFNIAVNYTMYRGYTGNDATESYAGSIYKDGEISGMKVLKSKAWVFPNAQLSIDTANKKLYYTKTKRGGIKNSPIDTKTFSTYYKESNTEVKGDVLRYEMVLKDNRIPSPYRKIVLYINTKTYQLEKQAFFFANKMPFVDKEGNHINDFGRLEIAFETNKKSEATPKLSDFLVIKNNTIQLASSFKSYTLIDQTKYTN
jgi:hypothetical protein